jgi:hypothetical protein
MILAALAATPEIPRFPPVNKKQDRSFQLSFNDILILTLILGEELTHEKSL